MKERTEMTYLQKMSSVFGISVEVLQHLRDLGFLDEIAMRNALLRSEYAQLEGDTVRQKMEKLRKMYNLDIRQLQNIVHTHIRKIHYCKYCGKRITPNSVAHHDGVCPQCISNLKL